jgi:peptidoglycan/LPS O-acetylase OafA/YrhL
MMGALGALLYKRNHRLFLQIADNKISQAICWMVIVLLAINKFHLASIIDNEIVAVVGLVLIIGQINTKNRIVNLELNVFDYLGKISYGIYVIHPLIIFFLSKLLADTTMHTTLKYGIVYSSVLAATIITAHFSYYYFERYFMNLKKKFVVIESASEKSAGAAVMATA